MWAYWGAAARGTEEGDTVALDALAAVGDILEANDAARLGKWRDRVATRSGACSWVKSRLAADDLDAIAEGRWPVYTALGREPAEVAERHGRRR